MLSCQDGRTQDIEKSVHPGLHLFPVLPEWMMQTGRKFDRHLMRRRHDQRPGDLRRSWKCIRRYAAGTQFETKRRLIHVGIELGQQRNCFWRSFGGCLPKRRQTADNRAGFSEDRKINILRSEEHTSELQSLAYLVC